MIRRPILLALGVILPATAHAEEETTDKWTGESSVSASATTGNSDTTDVGVAVNIARDGGAWTTGLETFIDYGEQDGVEAKNRFFLAGQADREINKRAYGFGRLSYEQDEFSGFQSRLFLGGGLGYQIAASEKTVWAVEGGPGVKIDKVRTVQPTPENGLATPVFGGTERSVSYIAKSDFSYTFNDNVSFTNATNLIYAEESTQVGNIAAITAALTDVLSARISLEVRHDTNPPLGFESTDTATRFSIVYTLN